MAECLDCNNLAVSVGIVPTAVQEGKRKSHDNGGGYAGGGDLLFPKKIFADNDKLRRRCPGESRRTDDS